MKAMSKKFNLSSGTRGIPNHKHWNLVRREFSGNFHRSRILLLGMAKRGRIGRKHSPQCRGHHRRA